jgi:hypothetical protein
MRLPRWYSALSFLINHRFDEIERLLMATQGDIDAITAQLTMLATELAADDSAIQAAIAGIAAQGVDVTALRAAVDGLSATVDATTALVPAAPAAPTTP